MAEVEELLAVRVPLASSGDRDGLPARGASTIGTVLEGMSDSDDGAKFKCAGSGMTGKYSEAARAGELAIIELVRPFRENLELRFAGA